LTSGVADAFGPTRESMMRVCKRALAGLVLLIATAGLLLSLGAGVGIWIVKGPVTDRATHVFERINAALDVADQGLDQVKASLARAAERLDNVKEEQAKLAQEPRRGNVARRLLARTVQQRVAPELGVAHETLHTVAHAAVVVNSVLEDVGNLPLLSVAGLDLGDLTGINSSLSQVESSAWELGRLLGEPPPDTDADPANPQLSRVEQTLNTLRGLIAAYEPQLAQVRQRAEQLQSATLRWFTPAAVLVSLVCFWIALSQISLLCHAWSWWRSSILK
jgi:hypothetical protein